MWNRARVSVVSGDRAKGLGADSDRSEATAHAYLT